MPVTFTAGSAERIRNAVRKIEADGVDRSSDRLMPGPGEDTIWGYITGSDIGTVTTETLYSFLRVNPSSVEDADLLLDRKIGYKVVEPATHRRYCVTEVNGNHIPSMSVVRLSFVGFRDIDGQRRAMYATSYTPTITQRHLPIHDHRDNVTGGGFAFAVYHPGTALPQQPWAL